ncbi:hypothetical protein ACQP3L_26530 [Escherichia coli]|uniref:Uncharacterized protein n=1 Tax=Escherichia coli TaxID=562 RepID=A0A3S6C8G2_ECOLX|nr:hypothetical protein [Escherichia coli]ESE16965.1 hypothetical protein HMPREF1623_04636 [Escherichia coli 910096-2]QQZ47964.1 hypothetical protein [Escherichia coli]
MCGSRLRIDNRCSVAIDMFEFENLNLSGSIFGLNGNSQISIILP